MRALEARICSQQVCLTSVLRSLTPGAQLLATASSLSWHVGVRRLPGGSGDVIQQSRRSCARRVGPVAPSTSDGSSVVGCVGVEVAASSCLSSPQNTSSPLGVICLCRLHLPSLGILGTALICAPVPASPLLSSGLSPLLPRYESFFGDRTAVHRIDLPFRVSTSLKPAQQLPKLTSQGPLGAAHTQSRIGRLSA